ncbi:MAG: ParB/RepB/Spo0J family partition protein [Oscillospiraceae bacterium]|jgi:ParB family chromosome partitioning protein|nr:ParB/RepB/Spo0J family partition protein [Oscillospiraceae bacterium]
MAVKQRGLGKGLDALFIDNSTENGSVATIRISEIEPNREQPRTQFDEAALRELADSIRVHGVIQPLVVRPMDAGGYQIVAGERRWRAARMAGVSELPVVVRQLSDDQTLEIAIIENLQREDLNVMELAAGYQMLMDQYGMTQEQVADKVGKSRPVVANTIRLLNLPKAARELVLAGKISQGHARALLGLEEEALINQTAQQAALGNILVRDIEKLARERKKERETVNSGKIADKPGREAKEQSFGDSSYREMELALAEELGRRVRIVSKGKASVLELEFYTEEELGDLAKRLTARV